MAISALSSAKVEQLGHQGFARSQRPRPQRHHRPGHHFGRLGGDLDPRHPHPGERNLRSRHRQRALRRRHLHRPFGRQRARRDGHRTGRSAARAAGHPVRPQHHRRRDPLHLAQAVRDAAGQGRSRHTATTMRGTGGSRSIQVRSWGSRPASPTATASATASSTTSSSPTIPRTPVRASPTRSALPRGSNWAAPDRSSTSSTGRRSPVRPPISS
jgi:hypothetical protein